MRLKLFSTVFLALILFNCRVQKLDVNQTQIISSSWQSREIVEGAAWKYHHFDSLFDSRQSVTIFEIDLNKNIKIEIPHVNSGFTKTSVLAKQDGAFAAINGSFFNTKTGGSVVFFIKEGEIIKATEEHIRETRDNAGFALDRQGKISIIKRPPEGWTSLFQPYTVLSSGPLLIYNGESRAGSGKIQHEQTPTNGSGNNR